ncbi:MAG: YceD family protein [Legionella sp.]|nr:YceD family protein [Legionella sp.]
MLINLKTHAANADKEKFRVEITERIPANIAGPCSIEGEFTVEFHSNYFLLKLAIAGDLTFICQRCLHEFAHHYSNKSILAVSDSDELANTLMNDYECIVVKDNHVDLIELITDELHLYSPQQHFNYEDCNREVDQFISAKNVT